MIFIYNLIIHNNFLIAFIIVNFIQNMFNKAEVRKQIIQYFKSAGSGENIVQAIKEALFLN